LIDAATVLETKEPKKRSRVTCRERIVLGAISRASGSPFSAHT